jgi:tRNA(His) 5'-end guanylyltransferase
MQEVTKFLVEKTNARLGYVQSDEISLGWEFTEDAPFNGRLFKLQSVLASMATSKFVSYILDTYQDLYDDDNSDRVILNFPAYRMEQFGIMADKVRKYFPSFDCRVFQVPSMVELANCFLWRENDATRNSISSIAQANFSHKELQGKSSNEMQEMIFQKTGKNFNDYPAVLKRGSYFKRVVVQKTLDKDTLEKIPLTKRPKDGIINRTEVKLLELPIMKTVANKVGTYFYNEAPVLYGD